MSRAVILAFITFGAYRQTERCTDEEAKGTDEHGSHTVKRHDFEGRNTGNIG